MSRKIVSGTDWELRLYKNGRFACLLNKRVERVFPDGNTSLTWASFSGADLSEVFGRLIFVASDEQLLQIRAAFVAASELAGEAREMQRRHKHALSVIQAAARPAKLAAALAVVAEGGAL